MKKIYPILSTGGLMLGLFLPMQVLGQDCYDYTTEVECQMDSSCEWIPPEYCTGEDTNQCKITLSKEECTSIKGCTWFDAGYGLCQPKFGKITKPRRAY